MADNNIKLAIFDLDGTVLDTLFDLAGSVNFALEKNGFAKRSLNEIRAFVGNGIKNLIFCSVGENVPAELFECVFDDFKSHYAIHCADRTNPYDGITDLIKNLKNNGIKTALVSNKADLQVQKLVKKYFDGLFDYASGEKDKIARKPAPDSVFAALKALDTQKENAVYIGDSEVDIQTAKNSGIDCITVTYGFRDKDFLLANGAKTTADSVLELKNILVR